MCAVVKYSTVPRRDTHEMQPHYSSATPIGGPEVAPPPPQKRVDPRTTTNSPVINRLQTLLCPGKGQCASKLELLDIAIPGSPAAHAMQLPCLQTGGQTFEIMCEPGRADRRRCRLLERVSWRTRLVRSGPRASGKNASCTGCSRAGAINPLRSLAASIRRHATPDPLSQRRSSVTAVLHTSPLR